MKADFNILHLLWAIRNIPSKDINASEKYILFVFLSCTGSQNVIWYNQESLQEMLGLTRNTLRKHLKNLAEKDFISINAPSSYFRTASNQYRLNIEKIMTYSRVETGSLDDPLSYRKGSKSHPLKRNKGSNLDSKGSNLDERRGENLTLKNEREELKEEGRAQSSYEDEPLPTNEDREAWRRQVDRVRRKEIPQDYDLYGGAKFGMAKKYSH